MEEQRSHPELSSMVKPRKPFRYLGGKKLLKEFISTHLQDVDDCSAVISSLETDGKGIPVLLKHYLRLNGTILSFNVDKDFSSCARLGLIMVVPARDGSTPAIQDDGVRSCGPPTSGIMGPSDSLAHPVQHPVWRQGITAFAEEETAQMEEDRCREAE